MSGPLPPLEGWAEDDGKVYDLTDGEIFSIALGNGTFFTEAERPRWKHECGVLRPDGHRTSRLFVGMDLNPAHVVTRNGKGLITIRPSISCTRCGMHGWVNENVWSNA